MSVGVRARLTLTVAELATFGALCFASYLVVGKIRQHELYWGASTFTVLGLPALVLSGLSLGCLWQDPTRRWLHALLFAFSVGALYVAWALDRCSVLTGYERWVRSGMPTAPRCEACREPLSRAVCDRLRSSPRR